ncbi:MAG TPA: M1 family aminopeptidase, partial [Dyadobacter sp.]|nr:M1 family aminopeptidase [Dyadobacter sp.]
VEHIPGNKELSTEDISRMEMNRHEKRVSARSMASLASTNFDVKYYRAEWEVDPAVNYIRGKVTAYYVMTTAGNAISFDLSGTLSVSQVSQRATSLASSRSGDLLQITFPANVSAGTLDSVTITYEGAPVSSGNGSFVLRSHGNPAVPVMWTLSEPFGSKDWWPCKNGLDDKADNGIDIFITHPAAYKAAANGLLKSEKAIAGNKTITHWQHKYPIASYLVCFAVTNYVVFNNSVTIGSATLPMQTHCYPENLSIFQAGTQNTLDGLQLFSNWFGTYPFINEKYGHVQFGWGGGMEHQTSSFMYNTDETLVMHELAHQWFGNKITCGSWEDIWLNEGFATHLASMYMEYKYPERTKAKRQSEINTITSIAGGSVRVDNVASVNRIFDNRLSYNKGSHLLYMLRWILGDQVFFNAVRNYINDPSLAFHFAQNHHLKAHLEAASGKDLTYFFDQWYTGQGHPSYQLEWSQTGTSVQFKLGQTTSHHSVTFFQLPVPVLFRNETTGQEKLVVANHIVNDQTFTENLGFVAETVTLDPDYWLISRNNTVKKVEAPLPVLFTYFKANCGTEGVTLKWGTSSEINADYFEIEKSKDGKQWSVVGNTAANGTPTLSQDYRFADTNNDEVAYYRIAEHAEDGKVMYSRIVQSDCPAEFMEKLNLSPNPVADKIEIKGDVGEVAVESYSIYDPLGRLMMRVQHVKDAETKKGNISVSSLVPGIYILQIETGKGKLSRSLKFLKQ